ncbi:MFS transporter [Kineococcus endophyticus]
MLLTVLLVGTVLLHGWGLRAPWNPTAPSRQSRAQVRHVVHSRGFIVLSVVFTTLALAFYMASLGLVPLLVERGFDHRLAATTLGLLGAGQLVGRLLYGPVVRSRSSTTGIVFVVVIAGGSILGLALLPPVVGVLITSAVVFGAARGAFTLLQASVVADRWGQQHYGAVAGVFAMPITTATAMAPWAAAAVTSLMGSNITTYLMTAAVLGLAGVLLRFSDLGGRH